MLKRFWNYSTELWETVVLIVIGIVILVATEPRTWVGEVLAVVLGGVLVVVCLLNLVEWIHQKR